MVSFEGMGNNVPESYYLDLINAILSLETPEETMNFLVDLCTVSEIQAMAQRYKVAELLSKGRTYSEILEETGVSTATISRVNKCYEYGSGGYKTEIAKTSSDSDSKAIAADDIKKEK